MNSLRDEPGFARQGFRGLARLAVLFLIGGGLAVPVQAGMVYGRVYAPPSVAPPYTLQVLPARGGEGFQLTTDNYGSYSLFLEPPGEYRVELRREGRRWEGRIQSFPNSVGQDVHLREVK